MSFSVNLTARSRSHALALLEQHKSSLPASAHCFLKTAIENLPPIHGQELRTVEVAASGHLCEDKSSYAVSNATLKVAPTYVPD